MLKGQELIDLVRKFPQDSVETLAIKAGYFKPDTQAFKEAYYLAKKKQEYRLVPARKALRGLALLRKVEEVKNNMQGQVPLRVISHYCGYSYLPTFREQYKIAVLNSHHNMGMVNTIKNKLGDKV